MAPRTRKGGAERRRREALEALWQAISEQNLEGMQSVLRERCDDLRNGALDTRNEATERHDPALGMCCRSGFLAGVEPLLDAGANIEGTNVRGATALRIAAQEGFEAIVGVLIARGSQIDATLGDDDVTPLFISAQEGHAPVVALLLEHNAQVDIADDKGVTSLLMAAQKGHAPVVSLLLEYNAQIDLVYEDDWNALHIAAYFDRPEVCALLIAKRLDPATGDNYGFSALSHFGFAYEKPPPMTGARRKWAAPFAPPLTDEEKEERVTHLKDARDAYLLQKLRYDNWDRRAAFMHTLVGSGIRLTATQTAEHALIQAASDKSDKIPPIPRKTKAQNIAYLNKQIFGSEGYVRKVTEYI